MPLEFCQAWCCDHFAGKTVPVPNHPAGEKPFPNNELKPPLTQFQAIPLDYITGQRDQYLQAAVMPQTEVFED